MESSPIVIHVIDTAEQKIAYTKINDADVLFSISAFKPLYDMIYQKSKAHDAWVVHYKRLKSKEKQIICHTTVQNNDYHRQVPECWEDD